MRSVLAIDLGGTSLRVGRVDDAGNLLALASHPHRIGEEADAWDWWHALLALLPEVLDDTPPAGIGLSGFTRSQVLVDASGDPVRPAQCFPDGRATAEAAEIAAFAAAGWTEPSAWHPLARLLWVARHDPAAWARARTLLQPKDWLALRLTGCAATDRIANAWAVPRDAGPAGHALLPPMLAPTDRVGLVRGIAGLNGIPVFCGAMDTWCATLGAGAVCAGGAYIVSGTTDSAGVIGTAPAPRPGLVTLPWGEGLFHTGGPSNAGADCLAWAAGLLGLADAGAVAALAGTAAPAKLLFLPYLTGERVPLWQPDARGVLLGLHRAHGPAELARAVLEGVALANRDVLERAGLPAAAEIRLSGGGARSDVWCRIRADLLGRPVLRARAEETGLVGAASVAWTGLGRFARLAEAQAAMAGGGTRFAPDPAARGRAEALFRHFRAAQAVCVGMAADMVGDAAW
jgi:xylulokinase